jgi:hypothetical protein
MIGARAKGVSALIVDWSNGNEVALDDLVTMPVQSSKYSWRKPDLRLAALLDALWTSAGQ